MAQNEPSEPRSSGARLYQGWLVALGAFLAFMFASFAHSSFGLFVVPASEELNVSMANANSWLVIMGIGSAILAPIAGRLIDRLSVRLIMAIGGVLLALSTYGISASSSAWIIMLLALPIAFASDSAGGIAANTVAARWFRRRRGRALALVGIGGTASGFVLAPLNAYLIVSYGWRTALMMTGALAGCVMILMVLLLIRPWPTKEQLHAAGEMDLARTKEEENAEKRVWTYRELITNRNFLLLAFGAGFLFACDRALLISIAPYLDDTGIGIQTAAFLISTLTGSAIVGKLIVGFVVDHVDPRKIFLVVAAMHVVLLLMFMIRPGIWIMFAVSVVAGIGIGGVHPLKQVLTASIFGSASFGTVSGTAAVIYQVLMMVTFRFIGEVRDRTGSYELAFQTFIGLVLIASFLIWHLKIPKQKPAEMLSKGSVKEVA